MNQKKLSLSALTLSITAILAGCAATNNTSIAEPDGFVQLNHKSGQIILPLDRYDYYGTLSNMSTFDKAKNIWLRKCLNKAGYDLEVTQTDTSYSQVPEERTYGLWLPDRAKVFGFDFPPESLDKQFINEKLDNDRAWTKEFNHCQNQLQETKISFLRIDQEYTSSLASKLASESYEQALSDERWSEIRIDWKDCLEDGGLTPPVDKTSFVSIEAQELLDSGSDLDSDELVRIANIESSCNVKVELTDRLGNLEGSIQDKIISKNVDALYLEKNEIERELKLADIYITKNL